MSREISSFLKTGVILFTAVVFALLLLPGVRAAPNPDTFNVTVNISAFAEITVLPTSLSWTQVQPGTNGATKNISIKNTGTVNISTLEVMTNTITMEPTNPLDSGDASKYAATGFLIVKNRSAGVAYTQLGRLEWNLTKPLAGETLPAVESVWAHGWYRNSSENDYLWLLENGTGGRCNETGTTFQIKTAPENATNQKRDLTTEVTNTVCGGSYVNQSGKAWGVFTCAGTGNPLAGQFVAVYYDCTKIYIYNHDKTNSLFPTVSGVPYLWSEVLTPSTETYMDLIAAIPQGVPAGDTREATVTITAT